MICNKVTYPTRKAAKDASNGVSAKHKQSMYVYQCESCRLFHLATRGKRRKRIGTKKYPVDLATVHYKVPKQKRK